MGISVGLVAESQLFTHNPPVIFLFGLRVSDLILLAFIHAPLADAKSIKSDTLNPNKNITGGLWVNSWDSATSPTEIPIIQAGNWSDFGIAKLEQPAQISPISSWHRVGN